MHDKELAPGLRVWTATHPSWRPGRSWDADVWCTYAETEEATLLVDPLVPSKDPAVLRRLDKRVERREQPVRILLTASQHRRSADDLARRYDSQIWDGEGPLPADVRTFAVEHPKPVERPLWLEPHRALVFGDALTVVAGQLRVWSDLRWDEQGWYESRLLPSLEPMCELPVEHVLVGHGPPSPGQELEAALARPPYSGN